MDQIKEILNPTLKSPNYYIITGPHGCRKSTLVNLVARSHKKGIIYVEGSDNIEKFGENFAKAINYPKLDINLIEWLTDQLSGNDYYYYYYYFGNNYLRLFD